MQSIDEKSDLLHLLIFAQNRERNYADNQNRRMP